MEKTSTGAIESPKGLRQADVERGLEEEGGEDDEDVLGDVSCGPERVEMRRESTAVAADLHRASGDEETFKHPSRAKAGEIGRVREKGESEREDRDDGERARGHVSVERDGSCRARTVRGTRVRSSRENVERMTYLRRCPGSG